MDSNKQWGSVSNWNGDSLEGDGAWRMALACDSDIHNTMGLVLRLRGTSA